jgi:radical SAM superfamily enzyme YgiQ (UPF0313 family)
MAHQDSILKRFLFKLNSNPELILPQLAAATPEKHNLKLIDDRYENPKKYDDGFDIVGISTVTPSAARAYELADYFRKKGKTVILGGLHPSALPHESKQHADSVVIGEAESSWPRLLMDFEKGQMKSFYKSENPLNLNEISFPRHDLLNIKPLFTPIATSRGCPYNCTFCSLAHMHGRRYRHKSIEQIVNEIKNTDRKFLVFLHDASLTIDEDYSKSLFKAMIPLKRKFIAYGSPPILSKNNELLELSRKAGCVIWCVGMESICQKSLYSDAKKKYNTENYEMMVKKIHKNDMSVFSSFVLGFDNDTTEIFDRTLQAAFDYNLDAAEFNILTPFPITRLFNQFDREKRIITYDWTNYDLHHVVFKPKNMSEKELNDGVVKISSKFYSPEKTIQRIINIVLKRRNLSSIVVVGAINTIMARFHLEFSLL